MSLSIVIPTYGRDQVLCDTIGYLLAQALPADEIVVVDQTPVHEAATQDFLTQQNAAGAICWLRHAPPGTVGAMNRGLLEARGELVLFLDDDLIPGAALVAAHRQAHAEHPEAWAVVGQVLQPEDWGVPTEHKGGRGLPTNHTNAHEPERDSPPGQPASHASTSAPVHPIRADSCDSWASSLTQDLGFAFNGGDPSWVTNVIGCNISVNRERALAVGGFDGNFTPPVAYRFETEFAKRLIGAGGRIWFEPTASIRHLRAARGGTRSQGSHLSSAAPVHGVGDYYYALRWGRGWERAWYMARRPCREVCTRFHLRHPWYIPVKLIGEMRAMALALRLYRRGPKLLR